MSAGLRVIGAQSCGCKITHLDGQFLRGETRPETTRVGGKERSQYGEYGARQGSEGRGPLREQARPTTANRRGSSKGSGGGVG